MYQKMCVLSSKTIISLSYMFFLLRNSVYNVPALDLSRKNKKVVAMG